MFTYASNLMEQQRSDDLMKHKVLNIRRCRHTCAKFIYESSLSIQNMDSKIAVGLQFY